MSLLSGDPYGPIETMDCGSGKPLRWWQAALILAPFAAGITYMLIYGKW
jgi:hypothetical protein